MATGIEARKPPATNRAHAALGVSTIRRVPPTMDRPADVAQLVEHFTRNEGVPGSNPGVGSPVLPLSGPHPFARVSVQG